MARDHARLLVSTWGDSDFKALSSNAQRLYWLIVSQHDLSPAGVLTYAPARWATFSADSTKASISRAVRELVERRYLMLDESTEEIWVRSHIRHDGGMKVPNVAVGIARAYARIVSPAIREGFLSEIRRLVDDPEFSNLPAWERPAVAEMLSEALGELIR